MRRLSDLSGPPDDARLAALAAIQHGVVADRQLLALGYTRRMLRTRVARGRLHPVFPGVHAVGHTRLAPRGRWMAAVLACGPGALLSHRAAGRLHGMLRGAGAGPIDVLAPGRHQLAGIRCHTTRRPDPRDATVVDGIPVTAWARTALDLAALLPRPRLRDALESAERRGRDFAELTALIARSPGHHGLPHLAVVLAELGAHAPPALRSDLEAEFLALIRSAGLPEPQVNVVVAGETVDFYWPAQRLIVEVDSYRWHRLRLDFESGRRRDITLQLAGHRVARFTDERIAGEPEAVIAELRSLLRVAA